MLIVQFVNDEKIGTKLIHRLFTPQHDFRYIYYSTNSSMAQLVKTSACNLKLHVLNLNTVCGF